MENELISFDETNLKLVVYSAALMSSIDRDVHESEWDIIQSFSSTFWREEYGSFIEYQKRIFSEINTLLEDETRLYEEIDNLTNELSSCLSDAQQNRVLSLMEEVMAVNDEAEHTLCAAFISRLGVKQNGLKIS
ncbi:hypothetical protein KKA14_19025 [bacterium]|nr:hypothetical protein [bacterium]